MVGFETSQFISNVGTFILFIVFYVLLIVCYIIMLPSTRCSKNMRSLNNKLGALIFWNKLVVAIIESVLIISFCCFILLKYNLEFDTFGEKVESWLAIGCIIGYIMIPAIATIQLLRNFDLADEKNF